MMRVRLSTIIIMTAMAILFSATLTHAQSWYDTNWQYRKQITIDATKVAANLTDFPVLVSRSSDADLAADAQADGDDLLFTAGDGTTKLAHEIESYNSGTGGLVAWVRVASLSSSSNTVLYLYYGNAGAASQQNAAGVWDSNYVMVQHLEETSGTDFDSTSYANNGTTVVVVNQNAGGQMDGADEFNGSTNYVKVPNAASLEFGEGSFTAEAWIYPDTAPASGGTRIVNNRGQGTGVKGWQLKISDATGGRWNLATSAIDDKSGSFKSYAGSGTYLISSGWHHVVMVYESDWELRFYVNGNEDGTLDVGPYGSITTENGLPTIVGASKASSGSEVTTPAQLFDGIIDEVRLSNTVRSAEWITTEFNNQNSPGTFYTVGSEETGCAVDENCGFCEKCVAGACVYQTASEDTKGECSDTECLTGFCDGAGACGLDPAGTECRAAADVCDVAELCDGISNTCPADGFASSANECRASAGACDVAENCTGSSAACPADGFLSSANVCRASAGPCDVTENCTGSSAACPEDGYLSSANECRASAGICDVAENCTGASASCPSDVKSIAVCRSAAGGCDVPESCDGVSADCPGDLLAAAGTECRAAVPGGCDTAETCTGISASCPPDAYQPAGSACGNPADTACTDPDTCDGSVTCLDNHAPAGVSCNDGLFCTAVDQCLNGQCAGSGSPCIPTEVCEEGSNQCVAIVSNDWWDSKWNYRKAITINASQVAADLASFPLLVDITDADLASYAQADGDDLLFTADDGTSLLDYEIESYRSTTGHLVAWVRIPTLPSTANTVIYLYYGNPSAPDSLGNPNGVWDADYVMVQHLDEVSGTHFDSTSNANNGTTVVVSNQDAAGMINGADEFDGSTSYIRVPDAASLQFGVGSFTAEAWIYPHAAAGADGVRIVNNRGTGTGGTVKGWQLKIANSGSSWVVGRSAIDDGSNNFKRYDGTTTYAYNQWYQVVMVYEADQELRFYVDGSLDGTLAVGSYGDISNALPTVIGASLADLGVEGSVPAQVFDGRIDEVRLSDVARTAAWIQTSYNNQSDLGSFYTLGPAEAEPCEGNFNCDSDVDGTDASVFKLSFGRSSYKNPCTNVDPCDGDFDCDGDVDGSDAQTFKQDFGRGQFNEPCPPCVAAPWCSYP